MKKVLSVVSIAAVMAACNGNKDTAAENAKLAAYVDSLKLAADTAGLAEYRAFKSQSEIQEQQAMNSQTANYAAAPVRRTTTARRSSSSNRSYSGGSNSTSSAPAKKGWSKAAKGAVIGAGGGAVIGAVINKKNRAAGAVIGGVLGGGVGYGIGRGMDKRDGRY